jgi:ABC-type Fe3+ transport system substrate-binding protein
MEKLVYFLGIKNGLNRAKEPHAGAKEAIAPGQCAIAVIILAEIDSHCEHV